MTAATTLQVAPAAPPAGKEYMLKARENVVVFFGDDGQETCRMTYAAVMAAPWFAAEPQEFREGVARWAERWVQLPAEGAQ